MRLDLRLYLVSDPATPDLELVVGAAVTGGVTCVQVRDKHGSSARRVELASSLRAVLPAPVLVLANDDLAAAEVCDGLHVGLDDLAPSAARAALGPEAVIGWSINDLAQLSDEAELAACSYVAVSPVWATPSKLDTGRPFGLAGVGDVARALGGRMPLVAIGGIEVGNAAAVIAAGADGVAVVRAVGAAADPAAAARELRGLVDGALAARDLLR